MVGEGRRDAWCWRAARPDPRRGTPPAGRLGYHVGRRRHFDLVERRFYSPVPDFEALPENLFDRESELAGIHLDAAEHMAFAESRLAPYVRELDEHPQGFPLANDYYAAGDAHLAYPTSFWIRRRGGHTPSAGTRI